MLVPRYRLVLPYLCLAIVLAWAPSAYADKKHPAEEKGTKSTSGDVETTIKFVNKSKQTIKIYWLDYDGERVTRKTVKDGESYEVEKTYLTHPWLVTDEKDDAWYVYFPDAQSRTVVVVAPDAKERPAGVLGNKAASEKKHPAEEQGTKSTSENVETTMSFANKSKQTIKVYWLDEEGKRVHYKTLEDGESYDQMTYLTHPWLITDENDNAWYVYFPDAQPRAVTIVAPEKK